MSPLQDEDRVALRNLARQAIHVAVLSGRLPVPPVVSGALAEPSGAFVTIHRLGLLRGCIGQIEPVESLAHTVMRCAVAAALDDPRFAPVQPEELAELRVEISILSLLKRIRPEEVVVGVHGLLVARGRMRGVLLPQVADERHWNAERFLEETCLKAGLERDAWKEPAVSIEAFTVEIVSDHGYSGKNLRQAS